MPAPQPPVKTVDFDPAGGPPRIEILIGHANFGHYDTFLWDTDRRNPQVVGSGLNTDQIADEFPITNVPAPQLTDCFLSWQITIAAPGGGNAMYSTFVKLTQDGRLLGLFPDAGSFSDVKIVFDFVQFKEA